MILKNCWYLALPSHDLKKGQQKSLKICGEPLIFIRKPNGEVFALRDICPHRGIPLSYGKVVGDEIECPYHGWRFGSQGHCTLIPSLTSKDDLDCTKIKIRKYEVREQQGNVWVFVPDPEVSLTNLPEIPWIPGYPTSARPQFTELAHFACHLDHAVTGLMDPAHGPYVHQSWFWRSRKSMHEKEKKFGPVPFGFQMRRHAPSSNSRAYKIFGGKPQTEITFYLPSVRIEHVQVGEKSFVSFTALTPIDENNTMVTQHAYWDMKWMHVMRPLVKLFTKVFLYQDRDAIIRQQEGLKYNPPLMLIKDSDTQAKWYFALKKEWAESTQQRRAFQNPVPETVLRWKT